jgi:hypothetical protein
MRSLDLEITSRDFQMPAVMRQFTRRHFEITVGEFEMSGLLQK